VLVGLAAGLLAAVLFGVAAVAQAHAARNLPEIGALASFVRHAVRDPWMIGVVVAYLAGFGLHAVAIWLLPLYLAQAAVSVSMPVTAVVASTALQERLGPARWVAVALITVGLVLLAVGSGEAGQPQASRGFAVVVWTGAVLILLAGLVSLRRAGGWLGGWLGALSGLGYAGSAIAVRGLDTPVTPLVVVIALAVPVLGVVAFWIYSMALDRAGVAAATGPLIVAQTFVPAAVGVLALDDGVRSWPVALTGLVVATGATIGLSREG